ncbi:ArsR/SmtB family transcription factor [candidate division CSSED10-310 bacterium]|uniref:ArsR/SmtB family transcription factor n=1 Tax=candidate division CSSED10-310 bacterium TaxID=2855610 RepID=A0ABV6Z3C0_UNCC1
MTYFKALADETRLRLLNVLAHFELNVNEIVDVMQMGQSRISRHLKILADANLVASRRDGLWVFYSLIKEGTGKEFVQANQFLMESEPVLQDDIRRTRQVIADRSLKSVQFFDAIAGDWTALKREIMGDFDLSGEIVRRIPKDGLTVDLGCGNGDLLHVLEGSGIPVIGVDRSIKMLEVARKSSENGGLEFDLRIGELEHLPLRDREVGTAILNMVLHHLHSPIDCLKEVHRVLEPRGTLIIAEFLAHNNEYMRQKYHDRWLGFTQEKIGQWLRESGFSLQHSTNHELEQGLVLCIYESQKKETKHH